MLDGCDKEPEEVIIQGQRLGVVNWRTSGTRETVVQSCPCSLGKINRQASRSCAGDFTNGISWMESDKSLCKISAVAIKVCNRVLDVSVLIRTCNYTPPISHSIL